MSPTILEAVLVKENQLWLRLVGPVTVASARRPGRRASIYRATA